MVSSVGNHENEGLCDVMRSRFVVGSVPLVAACTVALIVLGAAPRALGYPEPNTFNNSGCNYCHDAINDLYRVQAGACTDCHASYPENGGAPGYARGEWYGPHGGYTTGSKKCRVCHSVHDAPGGGVMLLPGPTVTDTCFTCHDGTGGFGVYGTILARTGIDPQDRNPATPGAAHRMIDATSTIPGGDAATGGSAQGSFSGTGGVLACNDCHSPHGANTVQAFKGDRRRVRAGVPAPVTSRLLKRAPTGASAETTSYGSDWCLACHKGRSSSGMALNHPVDSGPGAFTYARVAILVTDTPTSETTYGPLGGIPFLASMTHTDDWPSEPDNSGNRGFLMPYPRTPQQTGHAPICQQCHEDARRVGELVADGTQGDAATATVSAADYVYWNGSTWVTSTADNPAFQNFPHETANDRMLVETYDDLCLNCHPLAQLP